MIPKINLLEAKTVLTKSGLPGSDWVVNPYNGCLFGCLYCYAAQIARWKHPDEEWGTYLDVKINAPDLLKKELYTMSKKTNSKDLGSVFLSSITDPYVGIEVKYKITRQCLEVLADFGYEGAIAIQTKSSLVTRDMDILKELKKVSVGFTVTTLDDKVSRFLEIYAPPVSERIKALEKLHKEGIVTYAFIGPILPYFTNNKEKINELLDALQNAGVKEVWFEHINLNTKIKERLYEFLKKEKPKLLIYFEKAENIEYRQELDKIIEECLKGRNMKLVLGKVIHHRDLSRNN